MSKENFISFKHTLHVEVKSKFVLSYLKSISSRCDRKKKIGCGCFWARLCPGIWSILRLNPDLSMGIGASVIQTIYNYDCMPNVYLYFTECWSLLCLLQLATDRGCTQNIDIELTNTYRCILLTLQQQCSNSFHELKWQQHPPRLTRQVWFGLVDIMVISIYMAKTKVLTLIVQIQRQNSWYSS